MNAPKIVTSLANDRIKAIRALEMRKSRKETGLFVAEGAALMVTARDHGFAPETLVYQKGEASEGVARGLVDFALKAGGEVLEVSPAVLDKLSAKDNPQSLIAVYRQRFAEAPEPRAIGKRDTWVALEEIRDPGNLGTIIRTADATGCAGVILIGTTCDPFAPEAVRATMGSIFAVPIVKMERSTFHSIAKKWQGTVVGTHLAGTEDFRRANYEPPALVVMGGEGPGLSSEVADVCSTLVKIPMAGRLDSLNLAIATALMLYQVRGEELSL